MKKIRIATRKSQLALYQTNLVADQLKALYPTIDIELIDISTKGDEVLDKPLAEVGGKALFVKGLEQLLLDNKADIAVHSLKDVPADLDQCFTLRAYLKRHNPSDVLVSREYDSFDALPIGAVVGTSSPRRQAQLQFVRPDIRPKLLRGNVNTRLAKAKTDAYDAVILARAGLERLGLDHEITASLSLDHFVPSAGQGIIAVELLSDAPVELVDMIEQLNDISAQACAIAEREVVKTIEGDCHSPIGAYAIVKDHHLQLTASVLNHDGTERIDVSDSANMNQAVELGQRVAEKLITLGARRLLALPSPLAGEGLGVRGKILICRPEPFGTELVDLLKQSNINAACWPALTIAQGNDQQTQACLNDMNPSDKLIITSQFVEQIWLGTLSKTSLDVLRECECFAIGKGTAEGLIRLGFTGVYYPETADSESLLSLPELHDVEDQTFWLLRGQAGRDELITRLEAKGAVVNTVCCYEREANTDHHALLKYFTPHPRPLSCKGRGEQVVANRPLEGEGRREQVLAQEQIGLVVLTSLDALKAFWDALSEQQREIAKVVPITVMRARMLDCAKAYGFKQIVAIPSANNQILANWISERINVRSASVE